ncbi:RsfA family transcriptional regulator [Oceanobacillus rekensis]|uniref:RsfA family transcriptional regulator n=1 Tax=Oceanobacillus rekensis TaxID=937927 RepID=UPI000B43E006|nr:RsfA family transcriptional regulator [Oceanobacillus rekensis]
MNDTRQDAWTQDEDLKLAETVLRFIREGRTQLEAFREVANKLSRTSAACGFRWNATIRKQYQNAIQSAKEERKSGLKEEAVIYDKNEPKEKNTIDSAIQLLIKMKSQFPDDNIFVDKANQEKLDYLESENEMLKDQVERYDHAWQEMQTIWSSLKD